MLVARRRHQGCLVAELLLAYFNVSLWKGSNRGPQSDKAALCDMTGCGPHGRESRAGGQPAP